MEIERKDYPLKGGNSKVYEVNETNRDIIDYAALKMYSPDKKFVLIYDDTDRKKMELFWEFTEWQDIRARRSREDEIFDSILSELDPLDKSAIFKDWKICFMFPDENSASDDIQAVEFESEKISTACLFSRLDAKTKGATPLAFGTIPVEKKDGKAKGFAAVQLMTDIEMAQSLNSSCDKGNIKMKEKGTNE